MDIKDTLLSIANPQEWSTKKPGRSGFFLLPHVPPGKSTLFLPSIVRIHKHQLRPMSSNLGLGNRE